MGEGKKIIDLRHGRSGTDTEEETAELMLLPDMVAPADSGPIQTEASSDSVLAWTAEAEEPVAPTGISWAAISALGSGVLWTGLFCWASMPQWQAAPTGALMVEAVWQWAIPIMLILIVYLVIQRNSMAEARRFAGIAGSLRTESVALDARLSHINSELSLAREFLANQSLELESLGRVSSDRLRSFAEELRAMIEASDKGMRAIGDVSEATSANMDKLRNHLPVIATSAKDVTNQIGNAGRTAQSQVESLIVAFQRLNEFGQAASKQIGALVETSDGATQRLAQSVERSGQALTQQVTDVSQQMDQSIETVASRLAQTQSNLAQVSQAQSDALNETLAAVRMSINSMATDMTARAEASRSELRAAADDLTLTLDALATSTGESEVTVRRIVRAADKQISEAEARLKAMDKHSTDALARLAFAVSALDASIGGLNERLADGTGHADVFDAKSERLRDQLESIEAQVATTIPRAFADLDANTDASVTRLETLRAGVSGVDTEVVRLGSVLAAIEQRLAGQQVAIGTLASGSESSWRARAEEIDTLITAMRTAREDIDDINGSAAARLAETMRDVQREAQAAADEARRALDRAISATSEKLGEETGAALEKVLRSKAEELVGKLDNAINRAVGATGEASLHLKDQLSRVDELASHLERRVAEARERAEEHTDNDFARRMALLTESLNSTAIDVDKILRAEVSDTAWSAYLRGDRGVFTRRAVRLIDNGEAKDIAAAYENDPDFYELVNRYIHDFEAMLRTVLSTRDGGVMGVTLLSSETGKLYVALAQAIERLRD